MRDAIQAIAVIEQHQPDQLDIGIEQDEQELTNQLRIIEASIAKYNEKVKEARVKEANEPYARDLIERINTLLTIELPVQVESDADRAEAQLALNKLTEAQNAVLLLQGVDPLRASELQSTVNAKKDPLQHLVDMCDRKIRTRQIENLVNELITKTYPTTIKTSQELHDVTQMDFDLRKAIAKVDDLLKLDPIHLPVEPRIKLVERLKEITSIIWAYERRLEQKKVEPALQENLREGIIALQFLRDRPLESQWDLGRGYKALETVNRAIEAARKLQKLNPDKDYWSEISQLANARNIISDWVRRNGPQPF